MRHGGRWAAALLAAWAVAAGAQTQKELVERILVLQQPGVEALARGLVEQSVAPMIAQVGPVVAARVPAERRQALLDEMKADVQRYVDESTALLRDRAARLAPSTIGRLLEERFSEDELRQLLAMLESPVNRKFQQLGPELQKTLVDQLVSESKSQIDPKLKALDAQLVKRLRAATQPAAAASAPLAASAPADARKP